MDLLRPAFVLERRINIPLSRIETALNDNTVPRTSARLEFSAGLLLDAPFLPRTDAWPGSSGRSWSATGVLITDRCRSVARVEIEIGPWSQNATRLELRPVAQHPHRWSQRRLHRYFRLAHLAADQTASTLTQTAQHPTRMNADDRELVGVA
jgi:hypothetical protein